MFSNAFHLRNVSKKVVFWIFLKNRLKSEKKYFQIVFVAFAVAVVVVVVAIVQKVLVCASAVSFNDGEIRKTAKVSFQKRGFF